MFIEPTVDLAPPVTEMATDLARDRTEPPTVPAVDGGLRDGQQSREIFGSE
jgi:hypothetical protein